MRNVRRFLSTGPLYKKAREIQAGFRDFCGKEWNWRKRGRNFGSKFHKNCLFLNEIVRGEKARNFKELELRSQTALKFLIFLPLDF